MFLRGDRPLPLCCKCDDQYNLAYDHTAPLCVSWLHRDVRCHRQYTCEAEKAEKNKATAVSKQQSFEGNHRCFFELEDFGCFLCFVVFCVFCLVVFSPLEPTGLESMPGARPRRPEGLSTSCLWREWLHGQKDAKRGAELHGIIAYAANIAELNLKFEITQRLNGLARSIGLLPLPCVFHVFEAGSSCFESHR